jgi:hypothetical protein
MSLQSALFKGDLALEACLIRDSAHVTVGASGEHVAKVQRAVLTVFQTGINNGELAGMLYGGSTAAAVLKYKQNHAPPIINTAYQRHADNIVGKMTIAALDQDLVALPSNDPLTNPSESARIQQVLDRERLGALLMLQTVTESLSEVEKAFKLADVNPEAAAAILFVHRFTIDGLDRFFAINQINHETLLPRVITNFQKYLLTFPRLTTDQSPADYGFLLRHALFRGSDGVFFCKMET